jgi:hypothetical protein
MSPPHEFHLIRKSFLHNLTVQRSVPHPTYVQNRYAIKDHCSYVNGVSVVNLSSSMKTSLPTSYYFN